MTTRPTRDEIETAVAQYRDVPKAELPDRYRAPATEHDFSISIAIMLGQEQWGAGPVYDADDVLIGWRGIRLPDPNMN